MKNESVWIAARAPQVVPRLLAVRVAEFTATPGPFSNGGSEGGGNPRLAHAAVERCASTSALMSETNRSTSHISSSSASSAGVNAPSWLRRRSSCARAATCSDGRNSTISSAAGRRARKEITSRRRLELPDQVCRNPRAIISASRSRSGSNCRANWSGISMVNRMKGRLTQRADPVKPRDEPVRGDSDGQRSGMRLYEQTRADACRL